MPSILLKNATSITLNPPSIESVDLRISNGIISDKGKKQNPGKGEEVIDLKGAVVMPGLINSHTHLYSSLVRGMPGPSRQPKNFTDILKLVWWKLDKALDDEAVYYSALIGSIEAARYGTTMLIDHHASPNAIPGSLDIIKQAIDEVGIRGVLCYETSDRDGMKKRDEGLKENWRFIASNINNDRFRGLVGAHASFTLCDDSLRQCSEIAAQFNTGVHIHVAEAVDDSVGTKKNFKQGIMQRFEKHNILREHSIFAHAVHLTPAELKKVSAAKTWLVHNPRSNMNNQVGYAHLEHFGERSALGTDGFPADMFEEAGIGFYRIRDSQSQADGSTPIRLLNGGHQMASELFNKNYGSLAKGSPADIIILDYHSPTPMTKENVLWHFLFGMKSAMVNSVIVDGKWVVKKRAITGINIEKTYQQASRVAQKIWARVK